MRKYRFRRMLNASLDGARYAMNLVRGWSESDDSVLYVSGNVIRVLMPIAVTLVAFLPFSTIF